MDLGVAGHGYLIFGGTAGIGFEAAKVLAAEGARLVVVGRDAARAEQAAADLGGDAVGLAGDLTEPGVAESLVAAALLRIGGLRGMAITTGLGPRAHRELLAASDDDHVWLEVAHGLPCALTLASRDEGFARDAAALLHGGRLRVYYSADLVGVEIGGAVKNVMAIAAGISDGLGLGLNARAALITRGLAEIARLGATLGGKPETFFGLAGAGDLILTCTGELSRNRRVGLGLAKGLPLKKILGDLGHVAEGVRSAKEVLRLAQSKGVEMPVSEAVAAVLDGRLAPGAAVERLLSRDPKPEGS